MTSPRQLVDVILSSLATLDKACASGGFQIPTLEEPFAPPSEAFRADPTAAFAAHTISAAALQLAAILTPPQVSLYHAVGGHFRSAAIRACLESNVTEILREAGTQGLHVNDIAAKNGQDAGKLGRFLRFLSVNHIYREVSPDVFANTRISSMMDTMKSTADIKADPESKYDGTVGLSALASHHLDEPFKASSYAWETLSDPKTSHSGDPAASAFSRAFGTKETLWEFFERPDQKYRQRRFDAGMQGILALQPADAILAAYEWKDLPPKSLVVDVGGGVGASAFPLARDFPGLKVAVQDRPDVIENAKKVWATKMPQAVTSGTVLLEVQDFFNPQPKREVSIFLLKQILHDWSDEYCTKILKRLRDAASSGTKLIVVDSIMPYACHDPSADGGKGVPGQVPIEAPAPLLANFGAVNEMGYNADIDMFVVFNSQERTFHHFERLLRATGWKLTVVRRNHGDSTFLQSIEAVPI
ncbi:S-adenosyl-L-methionine-dependent methyltransferase [Dentipellis sp. KUC8613]|nr:S-adenosyl-L-methionine-dependent methyltransferase [Dentipellis sp. KUC8613]